MSVNMLARAQLAGVIAVMALAATSPTACADIIYVDDSAVGGANNGSSWANAFLDLQDALEVADAGDEIRIGQGTYKPAPPGGDRAISFDLVSGVVMQGGYAGFGADDPDALDHVAFLTHLSGSVEGGSSYHVVTGVGLQKGSELRGVRIGGGSANEIDPPHNVGAGMHLSDCYLDVIDCHIGSNYAYSGAAGVRSFGGLVRFEGCTFQFNSGSYPVTSSAGALASNSSVAINCLFQGNSAGQSAGAASGSVFHSCTFRSNGAEDGGAINGASAVINCLFENNHAMFGGAMRGGGYIVNCIFRGNTAGEEGGALDNPGTIINCVFSGNLCNGFLGGAIVYWYHSPFPQPKLIRNCTFVGNRMTQGSGDGAAIYARNATVDARNCIFWNNSAMGLANENVLFHLAQVSQLIIHNSDVQGWTGTLGGMGNHGNDPRFVDADGPDDIYGTADDDPRLRANSPCIDSGDSALLPPDQFDLDEDGDFTEPLPIDLDGLPRIVGASVDAGAFEFQGLPCRADIDGSGAVNINDLLAIINTWGPCIPGQTCNSDLDLSGEVTINDLLAVLTAWGDCP